MIDDLDELVDLPHQDADTATPNVDHSQPHDPHVDRLCCRVDRLLKDF